MKIKLSRWQIAVITIAVIGVVFWLDVFLSMFHILPGSGGKGSDENYVYVDYEKGNLIFYLSDDLEFEALPKHVARIYVTGFSKYLDEYRWEIYWVGLEETWNRGRECDTPNERMNISRFIYGKTPECFKEEKEQKNIRKEAEYYISRGVVAKKISTGRTERVRFMLVDCEVMNDEKCLEQFAAEWVGKGYGVYDCEATPERTCLITNSPAPPDIEERHAEMIKKQKKQHDRK